MTVCKMRQMTCEKLQVALTSAEQATICIQLMALLEHGRLIKSKAIVVLALALPKICLLHVDYPCQRQVIGLLRPPWEDLPAAHISLTHQCKYPTWLPFCCKHTHS